MPCAPFTSREDEGETPQSDPTLRHCRGVGACARPVVIGGVCVGWYDARQSVVHAGQPFRIVRR